MDDTNTSGVRKQRPKKDLVKFGEDMMRRDSFTLFLPLQSSAMAKQRQYLTPAIVPDSDDDTPDADITIVAHNSYGVITAHLLFARSAACALRVSSNFLQPRACAFY